MQVLIKKLGYHFKNPDLLRQALTRNSAVHEHIPGAALLNYQALELVGDAQLKAALSILLLTQHPLASAEEMRDQLQSFIADGVIVKIAHRLQIDAFLIKGRGEIEVTDKMRVDALKAILGAVALDSMAAKKGQKGLMALVKKLWGSCVRSSAELKSVIGAGAGAGVDVEVSRAERETASRVRSLSPHTQHLFSSKESVMTIGRYKEIACKASDLNAQNVGRRGDTPLMSFFRKKTPLTPDQIARAHMLLELGARWDAPNLKGETADDLLRKNYPALVSQFKRK